MNRSLIFLAVSLFIWGVGEGMFLLFQPLYLEELGADPVLIGSILGGVGIAMALVHLPAGFFADRFGRRPLLWAAWILASLATWIMALANALPVFTIGAALYGMSAFVASPLNGYVTAARGGWTVARALTIVFSAYNLGAILGPVIGGYVGENLGLRYSFVFSGLLFFISTAVVFRIQPQPVEKSDGSDDQDRSFELRSKRFILFIAIFFLVTVFMVLPQPLSQNFLQNERALNLNQIGWLIAARSAGVVFLNLTLGQLNARYGYLLAQIAMALFMVFVWQGGSFPAFLLGYFMLGSFQTARILAAAQGRSLVKASNMGMAYGLIEATGAAAYVIASPVAGHLYSLAPEMPYRAGLVGLVLAFILSIFFIPLRPSEIS